MCEYWNLIPRDRIHGEVQAEREDGSDLFIMGIRNSHMEGTLWKLTRPPLCRPTVPMQEDG